jgi:DNA-binding GntR family transcriptional regulator
MAAQGSGGEFVPPQTLAEAVVNRLREEILQGKLAPGAPIRDAELAGRLGVSITPVRESVAVLIAEGLVETLPNKRRCVAVLTQKRAQDLMDVLGVVVSAGLERVAVPPAERREFATACRDFAAAVGTLDVLEAESGFRHFLGRLDAAVGNEELSRASEVVVRRALGMIRLYPSEHLLPLWVEAFADIADLVEEDSAAAAARCRRFFAELVAAMSADPEGSSLVEPEHGTLN